MGKKQLIMEKSLELFAKQGFEATSIQQITDNCGISKGAFYLIFNTKDELIIALIDQFMKEITSDIDHLVKTEKTENLLYAFYSHILHFFNKHSNFGKLLLTEKIQTINKKFLLKLRYYQNIMDGLILTIIERMYGDKIDKIKYDLMYCIKSFTSMYSELFFAENMFFDLDIDLLVSSLVEKTNILAEHTSIAFIPREFVHFFHRPSSEETAKGQILESIEEKIEEMDDSIERESLILLKDQIITPTFNLAIIKGLIENIRNHPHCKWIAYLLFKYFAL